MIFSALTSKLFGGAAIAALAFAGVQSFKLGVVSGQRDRAVEAAEDAATTLNLTTANLRASRAEAALADKRNVTRVGTEQTKISTETVDDLQTRLAALRADFAERVRRAQASAADPGSGGSPGVSAAGESAVRVAEAPRENRLPLRDALIASEQAVQLDALITWVEKQSAVDVNGEPQP